MVPPWDPMAPRYSIYLQGPRVARLMHKTMQRPINRIEWGPLGPPLIQGLQLQVDKHPFSKTSTRSVRQAPERLNSHPFSKTSTRIIKQTSASIQAPEEQAAFEKRWVFIKSDKFQLSYDNFSKLQVFYL